MEALKQKTSFGEIILVLVLLISFILGIRYVAQRGWEAVSQKIPPVERVFE
jgi:hypothetical protein